MVHPAKYPTYQRVPRSIAYNLRFNANSRTTPEPWFVGVLRHVFATLCNRTAQTISLRIAYQAMQMLDAPTGFHESAASSRATTMAGFGGLATEIERRVYQRLAEVPRPDMIHRYARRERIASIGDPVASAVRRHCSWGRKQLEDRRRRNSRNVWLSISRHVAGAVSVGLSCSASVF